MMSFLVTKLTYHDVSVALRVLVIGQLRRQFAQNDWTDCRVRIMIPLLLA
jgi:hypothetical protein